MALKKYHHILKKPCLGLLAAGFVGCSGEYKPDICTIVDYKEMNCVPTDPAKEEYVVKINSLDAIGYACFSPSDFSEGKKRARKILENLD